MELAKIHACLSDRTRLRILHLLLDGPLCVCHFQGILKEPQVKISKHLAYLRKHKLVSAERCANMMIYRLPCKRPEALQANLDCLRTCAPLEKVFRDDAARLQKLHEGFDNSTPLCIRARGDACCQG